MSIPFVYEARHLSGIAALAAAQSTRLHPMNGEMDTAFVKRIVCAYMNAHAREVADGWPAPSQEKALHGLLAILDPPHILD